MSKKDRSQLEGGTSPEETAEDFKAKKREAAARFKENKKKEKAERIEGARALVDEMKGAGLYDRLSASAQEFLNSLANPASGNAGTSSTFTALFGANPKVGDKVTLIEAFQRTLKGKANIDSYIKKWAEKGTVVSFQQDSADIRNSVYVIEQLA